VSDWRDDGLKIKIEPKDEPISVKTEDDAGIKQEEPSYTAEEVREILARELARFEQNFLDEQELFYAFVTKIQPLQWNKRWQVVGTGQERGPAEVTWEAIPKAWFDGVTGLDRKAFWAAYPIVPAIRLKSIMGGVLVRNGRDFDVFGHEPAFKNQVMGEDGWFVIALGRRKGILSRRRDLLPTLELGPETATKIVQCWAIGDDEIGASLADKFYAHPDDVGPQASIPNVDLAFVGVLNVGQGGCNALFGHDGRPFLYYDFGRCIEIAGRPAAIKPCLSGSPTIVLSHWDEDHFELAIEYPEALHVPWLVPESPTGPVLASMGNALTRKRVWPKSRVAFSEYSWGFILRAKRPGANKNDNGLVLLARVIDDTAHLYGVPRVALDADCARPVIHADERYVLLTGDAMFHYIPSCLTGDLDGHVIGIGGAHHGTYAGLKGNEDAIPLAAPPFEDLPAAALFSYGAGNHYGHPEQEALDYYHFRGYHHHRNTTGGSLVTGFRRQQAAAPGIRNAGQAIHTARGNFNVAVAALTPLEVDAKASRVVIQAVDFEVRRVVADATLAHGRARVVAAANTAILSVAYTGLNPSAASTLALNNAIVLAATRADKALADADLRAADNLLYIAAQNAAALAAATATALVAAVVGNDAGFTQPQLLHCENCPVFPNASNPRPHPVAAPPTPPVAGAVAPTQPFNNVAVAITEWAAPGFSVVSQPDHGLATGDQVTIACLGNANYNGARTITRMTANLYAIDYSNGALVNEPATVQRAGAGAAAWVNAVLEDFGEAKSLVLHDAHGLITGAAVTIVGGALPAVYTAGPLVITCIDADRYLVPVGTGGNAVTRGGTVGGTVVEIRDAGQISKVTRPNHGYKNGDLVTITATANAAFDGNQYRIIFSSASVFFIPDGTAVVAVYNNVTTTRSQGQVLGVNVLITSKGAVSLVSHNQHGLVTGNNVTVNAGVFAGGPTPVSVVNEGWYTIATTTGGAAASNTTVTGVRAIGLPNAHPRPVPSLGVPAPNDGEIRDSRLSREPGSREAKAHQATAALTIYNDVINPAQCANNFCSYRTLAR
jgi:hypothetical protein